MQWTVVLSQLFEDWFHEQDEGLQEKILAELVRLECFGPSLSRPYADSVNGSRHKNMKELRIQYFGCPIRAFFAFDPLRQAIVLCAGSKSNDKRFYNRMINIADREYSAHLLRLENL
ncbi:type II toxin-antitoxin system RelE/ParE family toxin [Phytobacter sp. V91]|uniref:type II toxin-antitoxin system RelE/ParE family toxin n=1 Tax=Phytobacter sp. V91 TaxID=3369425 RepID=UPI003F5F631F